MSSPANNTQVGGSHYASDYQHWDLVWDTGMGYFPAQITKNISRHAKKNGLQDVQKAIHFAQKYHELMGDALVIKPVRTDALVRRYQENNPHIGDEEMRVIRIVAGTHDAASVRQAIHLMAAIAGQYPSPSYVNQGD